MPTHFRNPKKMLVMLLTASAALVAAVPAANAVPPPHQGTLKVCALPGGTSCVSHSGTTADPQTTITIDQGNNPDFSLSATGMEFDETYDIKYWSTATGGNCHDNGTVLTQVTSDSAGNIASANYNLPDTLPDGSYRICITSINNTSGQGVPVTLSN